MRSKVPRAYAIIGVASAAVLSAVVAAGLTTGFVLGSRHLTRSAVETPPPRAQHLRGTHGLGGAGIPSWITVALTVLLALYAVSLLVLVAFSHWRNHDDEEERAAPAEDDPFATGLWPIGLGVDLHNAAEAQLAALHRGTPRDAIVACWMGLQAAALGAGLREIPSETADEYMLRAMRSLELDPPALSSLASLYREARFSNHLMVEDQRDQAGAALRVLADQLAGRLGRERGVVLQDTAT